MPGFAAIRYRQKIYGFMHRSTRIGFCCPDLPNFDDLCFQGDVQ